MARKMKDSGIEWIGEVPEDWKVSSISNLSKIKTGNTPKGDAFSDIEGMEWVKTNNLLEERGVSESEKKIKNNFIHIANIAPKNSTLVSCIGDIGKMAFIEKNVGFNQQINAVIFKNNILPKYGFYSLYAQKDQHKMLSNGNVLSILNSENHKRVRIAFPPKKEIQEKIAGFLDSKTAKIENIKKDIEKEIEVLEDYKKSIIYEAVTKGLDKNVEMKDSGVEWIGEIPKHWDVSKVKYFYNITLGKMLQPNQREKKETIENYISAINIQDEIDLSIEKQMWFSGREKDIYRIEKGDLLTVEGGYAGKSLIWEYSDLDREYYFQNSILRARNKFSLDNRFLKYWMQTLKGVGFFEYICNKATIMHFTKEKYLNTIIVALGLKEQEKISDFLDQKTSEINSIISDKKEQILVLEEYKKSMIYEYVTGKKEVI